MSNSTSLRAARLLLVLVTTAAGALVLPVGSAHAATSSTGSTTTAAPLDRTATTAAARAERRRKHRRLERRRRELRAQKARRAFKVALDQRGDPYRYGATGPSSFDCSGLTSYAYHRAGLRLPRTSSAQAGSVKHIPRSKLRRGDLVFFSSGGHVYHVGMYAGRKHGTYYVLHAPYSGKDVEVDPIWTGSWFGGTVR